MTKNMSMFLTFGNLKNLKDYHDLYLKCDVLLSANLFEKFSNNILKNYGLSSSDYLSSPVKLNLTCSRS